MACWTAFRLIWSISWIGVLGKDGPVCRLGWPVVSALSLHQLRVRSGKKEDKWYTSAPNDFEIPKGFEFRGHYRDLNLWAKTGGTDEEEAWVVEYTTESTTKLDKARAAALDLRVVLQKRRSLLMIGKVPSLLNYDECGGNHGVSVIPVPDFELPIPQETKVATVLAVHAPAKMSKATCAAHECWCVSHGGATCPHGRCDPDECYSRAKCPGWGYWCDDEKVGVNPLVSELVKRVSSDDVMQTVTILSTTYFTRNTGSIRRTDGLTQAANWAAAFFQKHNLKVVREPCVHKGTDCGSQVVAEWPGETKEIIAVGAHLDDRATEETSSNQEAPGADDNGSGVAAILELARLLASTKAKFKRTVRLCLFTGEEQGLWGSKNLAQKYTLAKDKIIAYINLDMIGYKQREQAPALAFKQRYADMALTSLIGNIISRYVPELNLVRSETCCSDQMSFYEQGIPSAAFYESSDAVNPYYHKTSDKAPTIDRELLMYHTKAFVASTVALAVESSESPPVSGDPPDSGDPESPEGSSSVSLDCFPEPCSHKKRIKER